MQCKEVRHETTYKSSELLDQEIYFDEVADVLCVALAELPVLLPVTEVAEALLRTQYGPAFITTIVANMPDTFYEGNSGIRGDSCLFVFPFEFHSSIYSKVCYSLISNGERYEEDTFLGRARMETLRALCRMCPDHILLVRAKCVSYFYKFLPLVTALTEIC